MLFTLTFLTGAAIGMYVYVTVFKPVYLPENIDTTEEQAYEWSVIGKKRSNHPDPEYVHASFRLLGDRSYVYLPGSISSEALEPVEGAISKRLQTALRFEESKLIRYSEASALTTCASDSDGIDYEYRFTVSGRTYLLDTCETRLREDREAMSILESIWNEVEGGTTESSYVPPAKWLENLLRSHFAPEDTP